jgi:glycosyltransferase involved in cell wall biosynthesis
MRKIIYVDNFLTGHGYTPSTGATLVKLFQQEGYTVICTSSRHNKAARLADMLFTIAFNSKNAVALIATYSTSAFYFAWACTLICRLFHVPYIPCLHGGNLPERIKRSPKLASQIFANSYVNVAVSGYLAKSMHENNWKALVIPNNIHLGDYPFKKRQSCSLRLLWVRSFHQIYNPLLAIRVLHSLKRNHPSAVLTMVGPDKDGSLAECVELVNELKLEMDVVFTGLLTRDKWTALAASHDIFINTTNFDNLPVSIVEAMALGLITISTSVGGVPYLIADGKNGLLVPPNDEAAFVSAIERVLGDRQLCEKLGEGARKKAEEFDWNNIKNLWRKLFQNFQQF